MTTKQDAAGEIISWKTRGCGKVSVERFRDALKAEGFDAGLVSQSSPKAALKRALRQLGKDKVIKELASADTDKARFQLTGAVKIGEGDDQILDYDREAIFTLDLLTGGITSDTAGQPLTEIASWYAEALDERTRGDIKRVIQRLFDTQASIFCINSESGGSYFVPQTHFDFVERVDRMLRDLGGKLARFPVIDGTSQGSESIADAMEHWFSELVKDLDETVDGWDETTKPKSFASQADRFKQASFKLECAAEYLGDRMQSLNAKVIASKQAMTQKILRLDTPAAKKYVEKTTEVDGEEAGATGEGTATEVEDVAAEPVGA